MQGRKVLPVFWSLLLLSEPQNIVCYMFFQWITDLHQELYHPFTALLKMYWIFIRLLLQPHVLLWIKCPWFWLYSVHVKSAFCRVGCTGLRIFAYQPLSIATGPRQKPVSKQALATCIRSNQSQKWQNNHHQGFDLLLCYSWNWE